MYLLKKISIGFIITPGFRVADIIALDSVLRFHPKNKIFYIAENLGFVKGRSGFSIEAKTTFSDCKNLDVIVIGGMDSKEITNNNLLGFLARVVPKAKFIVAISNGVLALHKAGVIVNETVTSDRSTIALLKKTSLNIVDERRCVTDGRFITSGPSTGAIEAGFTVFNQLRGDWLTKLAEFNLEYHANVQYLVDQNVTIEEPPLPKTLKIGVFTAPDIYIPDIMGALDVLGSIPNATFYYLSHKEEISKSLVGLGPRMLADTPLDDCPPLDVLVFGATHPRYIEDKKILDFVLKQDKNKAVIVSVCAGTFIVGATGLLKGRKATTNYHQTSDLSKVGVTYMGNEVEEDGSFLSAGPAVGSYQVGLRAVEKLLGKQWSQYIEHESLEFAPKPIFGTVPKTASKSILNVTHIASFFLRKLYRPAIRNGYFSKVE